jgi:hypothetical protein
MYLPYHGFLAQKSRNNIGQTPLVLAAESGCAAVVKLLFENGAELESKDAMFGRIPLPNAAKKGAWGSDAATARARPS